MGNWVVVAQYDFNEVHVTEFIRRGQETKDQALEELRAALHSYLPRKSIVEQWRHVYRFTDQESYLLVIKGKVTKWECTLRVAELVSDSTDPAVAERVRLDDGAAEPEDGAVQLEDSTAEVSDEPQDRIPPGY
ncbi:hypothetical protein AB0H92_11830 [Streptomyces phaeochromogenes]|uniref:hypothetical protein n=1 Tax=Streptomyces phaeochromogenes TaxID=1923 RepID=UPI0033D96AB4